MSLRRLRVGELLALGGVACVVVSLIEPWYESAIGTLSAWDTFGGVVALALAAAAAALAMVISTVTERSTALPVFMMVWTVPLALAAVIGSILRVADPPGQATSLCIGPWLALAGSVAILVGVWQAMRDERPSLYEPATPPARPRPKEPPRR